MRTYTPKTANLVPEKAKLVFKGIIFDVYHWEQQVFDGTIETYEMLKRPDVARVLAIKDGKIVITKQEQVLVGTFLDIPGGYHDKGGSELDAAKRELKEETGITCRTWKLLSAKQMHTKIESINYVFLAYDAEDSVSEKHLDAGERIDVIYKTLDEVKSLIDSPEVRYLPKDILTKVNSIEELIALPALV